MTCLDELDLLDQDFSSSLSGITEALEARTLRLPVDEGAKVCAVFVYECVSSNFFPHSLFINAFIFVITGGCPRCQGCYLFSS